ncbi:Toprim domain-containing protein [Arcticibacter tournemirensis]|uniref:Toprim domain-containing protein n=1 Tax=Arcticibacter tournemirensis TaxID=699437 RepID=A0A5M9GR80_9SPHI|nr:toprim domain-containing protein [Arcticibacter tournemirensis]KAA8476860.1 toprim domain-containing protein [Arcticibacter tournemirensis]TQM49568.1 Toprim domain-containing protein [Arcticibacter tournemirensis]
MPKYVDVSTLADISIVDFLARLGHHPVRKTGKEHFYHSMLRDTKKDTPSFTVWDAGHCWKDWGGANATGIFKGGIVQLGIAYWPGLSFVEVLNKIQKVCDMDTALIPEYVPPKKYAPDPEKGTFEWNLVNVRELGSNFVLSQYLHSRGLFDIAKNQQVKEVYYNRANSPENAPVYYAVGWQNEHGAWEFSNAKGFKSCIGPKGISLIPGDTHHVAVFEGYMDYLSWQKLHSETRPTVIVLNAITMLGYALERIRSFQTVDVYFDNDDPGRKCTGLLLKEIPHAVDRSYEYQGYNDYNDKLKADLQNPDHPAQGPLAEMLNHSTGRKR